MFAFVAFCKWIGLNLLFVLLLTFIDFTTVWPRSHLATLWASHLQDQRQPHRHHSKWRPGAALPRLRQSLLCIHRGRVAPDGIEEHCFIVWECLYIGVIGAVVCSKSHWCWGGSCSFVHQVSFSLTPSLRRPYIHAICFWPPVGQRVNTHSVFLEFCRKPCQHGTRGCDKRWMTCIHAGVSRSPREHASVPPDKRHCRQWMSSLFCGFLHNPFIHDLFCWSSRHKFVKTDL